MAINNIVPRSLEHWKLDLGFKTRVKIQAWQLARQVLRAVNYLDDLSHLAGDTFTDRWLNRQETICNFEIKIVDAQELGYRKLYSTIPIMVVDDTAAILPAVKRKLEALGFTNVTTYSDPHAAIDAFRASGEKPQIIITDLSMPEINGDKLITLISAANENETSPRFILYSGDSVPTDLTDPVARVIIIHHVDFIQKGSGDHLFNKMVTQVAREIIDNLLPAKPRSISTSRAASDLQNNPYYYFMQMIIHDLNNLLTVSNACLAFGGEDVIDAEGLEMLRDNFDNIYLFVDALNSFAKCGDLNQSTKLEETSLPRKLAGKIEIQERWKSIPAEDRYKLAAVIDQYLKGGLNAFRASIAEMDTLLFPSGEKAMDFKLAAEKHAAAYRQIMSFNYAVLLAEDADQSVGANFRSYYLL